MIIDADPFHSSQFANTLVQLLLRELFLFWCKQDQPQPTHRGILFFHGCRRSISLADIVILVVFFFFCFFLIILQNAITGTLLCVMSTGKFIHVAKNTTDYVATTRA